MYSNLEQYSMSDAGGSVTLIFYSIGHDFWKEPFLNLVAAGATMSTFTHVEMAIGATIHLNCFTR